MITFLTWQTIQILQVRQGRLKRNFGNAKNIASDQMVISNEKLATFFEDYFNPIL